MSIELVATGVVAGAIISAVEPFVKNWWNKFREKLKKRQKNKFTIRFETKDGTEKIIIIETSDSDVALTEKNIQALINAVGGDDNVKQTISE